MLPLFKNLKVNKIFQHLNRAALFAAKREPMTIAPLLAKTIVHSVISENDVGVQTGRPSLVDSGAIVPLRASLNLSEMSEEEVDRRLTQARI